MRPPNHMPCSPDEATVAVLGGSEFTKAVLNASHPWRNNRNTWLTADDLVIFGATFWKPVPNPPENTRELTEEELEKERLGCYMLTDLGTWVGPDQWVPSIATTNGTEPWRCRVPIEKKVVAWPEPNPLYAKFATEELRDRAVKEANGRES